MHSSFLRGSDFRITLQREEVPHDRFFRGLRATDRVGVFAPGGLDGLGASLLVLAHTTAFYDRYRESGSEFFAYPDYFTFQRRTPTASYSMLDVWPGHKDVTVPEDASGTLDAILDRAINVLLVPAGPPGTTERTPVQMASARRNIRRCYAYSETGSAEHPTLVGNLHARRAGRVGPHGRRVAAGRRLRRPPPLAARGRRRLDSAAVVQRGSAGTGARPDPLMTGGRRANRTRGGRPCA